MTTNLPGQDASRKRLAKLLGVAPFRVELTFNGDTLAITLDGAPLSSDQMQAFERDVQRLTTEAKRRMN